MTTQLDGRTAIITGVSSGIGAAAAYALAEAGARVFGLDIKQADETVGRVVSSGAQMMSIEVDISSEGDVIRAFDACAAEFGTPDFAINCAGTANECSSLEETVDDFDRVIGVNLRGTFLVGREAIRRMQSEGIPGRVVNIASDLGYLGRAKYGSYCASKGGVLSLTRSWAREFAPNILVNSISPGPIDTPMLGPDFMSAEVLATETNIPLARIGATHEISGVVVFLCSPGASFITGQSIGANGGSVMP